MFLMRFLDIIQFFAALAAVTLIILSFFFEGDLLYHGLRALLMYYIIDSYICRTKVPGSYLYSDRK
ncbi:hypothetical protein AN946_00590 [Trueperella pyogenes]|nr:hypothetical protein AN946_00590 [Trueperella pyogenes]